MTRGAGPHFPVVCLCCPDDTRASLAWLDLSPPFSSSSSSSELSELNGGFQARLQELLPMESSYWHNLHGFNVLQKHMHLILVEKYKRQYLLAVFKICLQSITETFGVLYKFFLLVFKCLYL